jgi:hypothetical protein
MEGRSRRRQAAHGSERWELAALRADQRREHERGAAELMP